MKSILKFTAALSILSTFNPAMVSAHSRIDFHLLPAVSSGPLDPDWHPDGDVLAFAAKGDIWLVSKDGGKATGLTKGPFYYAEPAFSPDGQWLAVTLRDGDNLDIAIMPAEGGDVTRLTVNAAKDFAPEWSADGKSLYFTSLRSGNLDILKIDLASRQVSEVVAGPGNQFQPALSPDGRQLAFVAPRQGHNGSGSLYVMPADGSGAARLIQPEESSYRIKPDWMPHGGSLVFVSDSYGDPEIASVRADGGDRIRLTFAPSGEFDPAISPDGKTVAFVSNEAGNTGLFLMNAAGDARTLWRKVEISDWVRPYETGTIRGRIAGPDGATVPARLMVRASDGRSYAEVDAFHRIVPNTGVHYQHSDGTFEIELPVGEATIETMRGFEFAPEARTVHVRKGQTQPVEIALKRVADPEAEGWVSGDTHVHDLHEGRYGLTHESFFLQLEADGLHMANALIHMDGTKVMGRLDDMTGKNHPLSNEHTVLRYSEEFKRSFGHVAMIGLDELALPFLGGEPNTPYSPDTLSLPEIEKARAWGAAMSLVHPYNHQVESAADGGKSSFPVLAALGMLDGYDIAAISSLELPSAEMYYRALNTGLRIAATGGTDNFSDVWFDPSAGTVRTYARLKKGQDITFENWRAALKAHRTFATSGPLLFVTADGAAPGGEIADGDDVRVAVSLTSIADVDTVDIVVNGDVVKQWTPQGLGPDWSFETVIDVPEGSWIAARALGPQSRYVGDEQAFAHTSPVYVAGTPYIDAEDAAFLAESVRVLWDTLEARDTWFTPEQKETYRQAVQRAIAYYESVAS